MLVKAVHRKPPSKSIKKAKRSSFHFPQNIENFHVVRPLGGGTQSTYLIQNKQGQKFVLEYGAHPPALKIEIICNLIYKALGVPVPELSVFD